MLQVELQPARLDFRTDPKLTDAGIRNRSEEEKPETVLR